MEQALLRVLADPTLRERLAERGKRRAGDFTWEAMVSRTARLLQDAAGLVS